jgi:hypothetical protein
MPVLPRDPDIDMCARTACGVEHELLHGPPGVVFQRNQTVLVSSTVAANRCKLANARCSRVRVISADDLVSFRALDWSNQGEVYGQEASG